MKYYIKIYDMGEAYINSNFNILDKDNRSINAMYAGPGWTKNKNEAKLFSDHDEVMRLFDDVVKVVLEEHEYNEYTDELIKGDGEVVFKFRSGRFLSSITFTVEEV